MIGCSPTHKTVNLGDVTTAYEINCYSVLRSYADCRNYAAEICNGKCKELDKEEYNQNTTNFATVQRMNVRKRNMNVGCK